MPSRRAGTRSNDAASTIAAQRSRLGGSAAQHRDPAGQHGERGIVLDRGVAERREPALHGRQLPGAGRSAGPTRSTSWTHRSRSAVLQQVLEGHRRRAVGLVPVGGPQVQLGDDVGLDAAQLAEQELAEQGVVAVPLAPAVERDEEGAGRLEVDAAASCAPGRSEDRIAQRGARAGRARPCGAGTAGCSRAAEPATRGTGSRRRTGRRR